MKKGMQRRAAIGRPVAVTIDYIYADAQCAPLHLSHNKAITPREDSCILTENGLRIHAMMEAPEQALFSSGLPPKQKRYMQLHVLTI